MASVVCCACGSQFSYPPYSGEYVIYENKLWCVSCLIAERTQPSTKHDRWLPVKAETDKKIANLQKQTEPILDSYIARTNLYSYLEKHYNVLYFPKSFYEKMVSIFNGTYNGLKSPISPDDLLDMFFQKQQGLDKLAMTKWHSNQPTPINRIYYDLAVLMSKYSSYTQWKKTKEIEKADAIRQTEANRQYEYAFAYHPQLTKSEKQDDLTDVIDDIC